MSGQLSYDIWPYTSDFIIRGSPNELLHTYMYTFMLAQTGTQYEVIGLFLSELSVVMLRANGHDNDLIVNIELMKKTVEVTN